MKLSMRTVATLALTMAGASTAHAQGRGAPVARPFTFGVSAGAAIPMGKSSDAVNTGLDIAGLADYRTPTMPVGLRGELMFNRFGAKGLPAGLDGHSTLFAGIVNAVASLPGNGSVAPYFIGGPGVYSLKATVSNSTTDISRSKTAIGLNGGMGLNFKLGTLNTFAEARYHYVFTKDTDKGFDNTQSLPLVFGIRF